jgi:hypothetical protein
MRDKGRPLPLKNAPLQYAPDGEYWPYLYAMLHERNPKHRRTLAKFAPEKLSA